MVPVIHWEISSLDVPGDLLDASLQFPWQQYHSDLSLTYSGMFLVSQSRLQSCYSLVVFHPNANKALPCLVSEPIQVGYVLLLSEAFSLLENTLKILACIILGGLPGFSWFAMPAFLCWLKVYLEIADIRSWSYFSDNNVHKISHKASKLERVLKKLFY